MRGAKTKAAKRKPVKRKSPIIIAIKALNGRLNGIERQLNSYAPYPAMDTDQLMLFVRLERLLTHPEFQEFIRSRLGEKTPIDGSESHG